MLDTPLVFIQSYVGSGTTLLGCILQKIGAGQYVGELRHLDDAVDGRNLCSCGRTIRQCKWWVPVLKEEFDTRPYDFKVKSTLHMRVIQFLINVIPDDRLVRLVFRRYPSRYVRSLYRTSTNVIKAIWEYSPYMRTIDSSHTSLDLKLRLSFLAGNVKVVHLVRDGRGVSTSIKRRKGTPISFTARRWKRFELNSRISPIGLPKENVLRVRYESLCANPQAVSEQLLQIYW